jgi:hypothetical protein
MRSMLAISAVVAAAYAVPASAAVIDLTSLNVAGSAKIVVAAADPEPPASLAVVQHHLVLAGGRHRNARPHSGKMADGIALAFQNIGNNVTGVGGGDVGYWNLGGQGASAVGSVILSWDKNDYGLSTNGVVQGIKDAPFNLGASNNVSGSQTVSYNAVTHELTMTGTFLDNSTGLSYSISDSQDRGPVRQVRQHHVCRLHRRHWRHRC